MTAKLSLHYVINKVMMHKVRLVENRDKEDVGSYESADDIRILKDFVWNGRFTQAKLIVEKYLLLLFDIAENAKIKLAVVIIRDAIQIILHTLAYLIQFDVAIFFPTNLLIVGLFSRSNLPNTNMATLVVGSYDAKKVCCRPILHDKVHIVLISEDRDSIKQVFEPLCAKSERNVWDPIRIR
jgi:hypothetical protein